MGLAPGAVVKSFPRLLKDGITYHSLQYHFSEGKRNNTICSYCTGRRMCFGEIQLFVAHPQQCVLVRELETSSHSLIQRAGSPCQYELQVHQQFDFLNSYINPVSAHAGLVILPLKKLLGIAVLLHGVDCDYVAVQPNTLELHC